MSQLTIPVRLFLAFLFALCIIVGVAYLEIMLKFSTYIALIICLIAACLLPLIVSGND
ncbi:hypothetical protein ccbrp13_11480 [Ktedonobacteria bacterium brp13]|nr:hypothetical protein ccbrp13_11480 [Ktedonobacteria bacterium brp13]